MADDAATVEQLRAELRRLRELHAAEVAGLREENTTLKAETERRDGALAEALEHQTATAEVLDVIANSPTELQPVLDAIAERAACVCGAEDAVIRLLEGGATRRAAHFGSIPATEPELLVGTGSVVGRTVAEGRTLQIEDVLAVADELPETTHASRQFGIRTVLATPLKQEGLSIGVILLWRTEVKPFSDSQTALLQTFADQAVIAIENARLFEELERRNRELSDALQQQTATAEVLRIIAGSPTRLQPVLEAVAERAAMVCGAKDAHLRLLERDQLRLVAAHGSVPGQEPGEVMPAGPRSVGGLAMAERQIVHVPDLAAEPEVRFPAAVALSRRFGFRSALGAPLLLEGTPIGNIVLRRMEPGPFSDAQIRQLETFADQAVVAIENARLFEELERRNHELTETLE
jgi:GAF domain-containing protein